MGSAKTPAQLRPSSHNPRHSIRSPPIREFSRNLRQAVPSAHFIPLSNSSTALRLLSFRAAKPRRRPAALQHVSKHARYSYASWHRAQGRCHPVHSGRRPQTSARTKQRRFLGRSKFFVFQLCAHPGRARTEAALQRFSDVHLIEPHPPQTVPKPVQPDAAAINPPSVRYDTRGFQAFWISGAADFRRFGFPALSGASKANESQDLITLDPPKAGCRRNNKKARGISTMPPIPARRLRIRNCSPHIRAFSPARQTHPGRAPNTPRPRRHSSPPQRPALRRSPRG